MSLLAHEPSFRLNVCERTSDGMDASYHHYRPRILPRIILGSIQPFRERGNGQARRESPAIVARRAAKLSYVYADGFHHLLPDAAIGSAWAAR
jgi:hypothetical protein